jgi:hypothetical protein
MAAPQRGDGDVRPEPRPVLAQAPSRFDIHALGRRSPKLHFRLSILNIFRQIKFCKMLADDFLFFPAIQALRSGAPRKHAAVRIQQNNGVVAEILHQTFEHPCKFPGL